MHHVSAVVHGFGHAARADMGRGGPEKRRLSEVGEPVLAGSGEASVFPDFHLAGRPCLGLVVAELIDDVNGFIPVVRPAGGFVYDAVVELVHEASGHRILPVGDDLVAHPGCRRVSRLHARIHAAQRVESLELAAFFRAPEQSPHARFVPPVALQGVRHQQGVDGLLDIFGSDLVVRVLDEQRLAVVVVQVRVGLAVLGDAGHAEIDLLVLKIGADQPLHLVLQSPAHVKNPFLASAGRDDRDAEHRIDHVLGRDCSDRQLGSVAPLADEGGRGLVGAEAARIGNRESELQGNVPEIRSPGKILGEDFPEFALGVRVARSECMEILHQVEKAPCVVLAQAAGEDDACLIVLVVNRLPALAAGKAPLPGVDRAADRADAVSRPESVAHQRRVVLVSASGNEEQAQAGGEDFGAH